MKEKNLHYNKKGLLLSKKSFLERNILGLRNEGLLIFLILSRKKGLLLSKNPLLEKCTYFRKKYFASAMKACLHFRY